MVNLEDLHYPIALDYMEKVIVAGLRDGRIIEISETDEKLDIMNSHHEGEVWGLAAFE